MFSRASIRYLLFIIINLIENIEDPWSLILLTNLRLYIVIVLSIIFLATLLILGRSGFFELYAKKDFIYMVFFALLLFAWVHLIGRPLIFPITDRIPYAYNFAVADFPFILLLITVIMLVKKPGTASLTLLIYEILSQTLYYGISLVWFASPLMQGLPIDLYIFIREKAIFSNKAIFFRYRITDEEIETAREISNLQYIDGSIIGFLRGFFLQLSIYTVLFPTLYGPPYFWNYLFLLIILPWSIGNAISGALSVPIAKRIKQKIIEIANSLKH